MKVFEYILASTQIRLIIGSTFIGIGMGVVASALIRATKE